VVVLYFIVFSLLLEGSLFLNPEGRIRIAVIRKVALIRMSAREKDEERVECGKINNRGVVSFDTLRMSESCLSLRNEFSIF
jgi:hypothetical protein